MYALTKMSLASIMQSKLKKDYQLEIEWKESSLIPMIENRKAYLSWIHDLLKVNKDIISEIGGSFEAGRLLDMYFLIRSNRYFMIFIFAFSGTGSSCIYPQLGCRLYPGWSFLATGQSYDGPKHSHLLRHVV